MQSEGGKSQQQAVSGQGHMRISMRWKEETKRLGNLRVWERKTISEEGEYAMSGSCLEVASVCIDKDHESAAVKLLLYGLE